MRGLPTTATTTCSNTVAAFSMTERCPRWSGSNEPGYSARVTTAVLPYPRRASCWRDNRDVLRRRPRRADLTIGVMDLDRMVGFFDAIGWPATTRAASTIVETPGGRFGLERSEEPPRLELALSVPDPLYVDELVEVVDLVGGILMEPPQETAWGGWGCSFNDPEGNTWELGSPFTVTSIDRFLASGVRPVTAGPIVALSVPRRRVREAV